MFRASVPCSPMFLQAAPRISFSLCQDDDAGKQNDKAVNDAVAAFEQVQTDLQRSIRLGKTAHDKAEEAMEEGFVNEAAFMFRGRFHVARAMLDVVMFFRSVLAVPFCPTASHRRLRVSARL